MEYVKQPNEFIRTTNGMIVYKGKYGATRQYAAWLRNELGIPLALSDSCTKEEIIKNNFLILGSSIYIGRLLIGKWMKKNLHQLQNRKLFLFVVCGTPPNESAKLQRYLESSVPAEILHACHVYFLPGRLIYKKLSWFDKFMLRMGARLSKEPDAKEKLTDYDDVKKENLKNLLNDVRKLTGIQTKTELIES